jgi:hypothetical protein
MTLRQKIIQASVAVAVLLLLEAIAFWPPSSRIRTENYASAYGMTLSHVEALLGGPPGDYRTIRPGVEHKDSDLRIMKDAFRNSARAIEFWQCDDALVWVSFNEKGQADNVGRFPMPTPTAGAIDNLFWRAKRAWHRWFP